MKINKLWNWLFNPPLDGPSAIILLRLMAGGVFLWEGMLKFIYVNQGVGRFTKLGLPFPQATANMVGVLEIVGGILLIAGFLTRPIAIPFIVEMLSLSYRPRSHCIWELLLCRCLRFRRRLDFGQYCTRYVRNTHS